MDKNDIINELNNIQEQIKTMKCVINRIVKEMKKVE